MPKNKGKSTIKHESLQSPCVSRLLRAGARFLVTVSRSRDLDKIAGGVWAGPPEWEARRVFFVSAGARAAGTLKNKRNSYQETRRAIFWNPRTLRQSQEALRQPWAALRQRHLCSGGGLGRLSIVFAFSVYCAFPLDDEALLDEGPAQPDAPTAEDEELDAGPALLARSTWLHIQFNPAPLIPYVAQVKNHAEIKRSKASRF